MKTSTAWFLACRPKTLSVSLSPVLVGTAVVWHDNATLLWLPLRAQDDGVYIVAPGDTLGVIAARFGVPLDLLAQVNEITDPNRITVGQRLLIPTADGRLPLAAIPTAVRRAEPGDLAVP